MELNLYWKSKGNVLALKSKVCELKLSWGPWILECKSPVYIKFWVLSLTIFRPIKKPQAQKSGIWAKFKSAYYRPGSTLILTRSWDDGLIPHLSISDDLCSN